MNCQCINWARIDGRRTNHHPNCPEFKEEKFVTVSLNGVGYTMPIDDLNPFIEDLRQAEKGDTWEVKVIEMTPEEYSRLKEFEGY